MDESPSPVDVPTQVISLKPIVLTAPGRGADLPVRISAPARGSDLPVIVFSHGFGSSMDGYAPLVDFWAARGFAVIQPTHLDSRTLGIAPDDPRFPEIWRLRVRDLQQTIDQLDHIEASVPSLDGRLDRDRIAVAGHSWGGQTTSMLLGARVLGPDDFSGEDMSDPRVRAGVLFATPGMGGDDLTPFAAEHFPFMNPTFDHMFTPTLVIAGDRDQSALSVRGPDWFTDPFTLSPGPKSLVTLFGAEHSLGGIVGYSDTETTDENPERVALIQRLTTAYLRDALGIDETSWPAAQTSLTGRTDSIGRIDTR